MIAALGVPMLAQIVGNGMLAQDEKLSQPDRAITRLLADQGR